ncbi:hypothetical protein M1437_00360 [Patescibacteria group bacterium]|nr:hypothetical protein [Patescibacteria group bacterium]
MRNVERLERIAGVFLIGFVGVACDHLPHINPAVVATPSDLAVQAAQAEATITALAEQLPEAERLATAQSQITIVADRLSILLGTPTVTSTPTETWVSLPPPYSTAEAIDTALAEAVVKELADRKETQIAQAGRNATITPTPVPFSLPIPTRVRPIPIGTPTPVPIPTAVPEKYSDNRGEGAGITLWDWAAGIIGISGIFIAIKSRFRR